jgi:hypothetical protein
MMILDRRRVPDVIIAALLAALAFYIAHSLVSANWPQGQFFQIWFGPAVSLACGRGFADVDFSGNDALASFLQMKADHFSCDQLPVGHLPLRPVDHWTDFQLDHFYLMGALAFLWRVTGVQWQSLAILTGFLHGVTVASAYALFRLGMGRVVSSSMTALLLCSLSMTSHLIMYRDYSKAPFFILSLFGIGLMALHGREKRGIALASALTGLSIGTGIGFRQDALILAPLFVMAAVLFLPNGPVTRAPKDSLTALFCFGLCFFAGSAGVLLALMDGSNSWHVSLLGLLTEFAPQYQLVFSPLYEWVTHPSDGYIVHIVSAYRLLIQLDASFVGYQASAYDAAGFDMYKAVVWTTPYDFMLRAAGVFDQVYNLPFRGESESFRPYMGGHVFDPVILVRQWVGGAGAGYGILFPVIAGVVALARDFRKGALLSIALVYLGSYPTLQNLLRHTFHLEVIGWGVMGLILSQIYCGLTDAWAHIIRGQSSVLLEKSKRLAGRILAITVCLGVMGLGTCRAAYAIQQHNMKKVARALTAGEGRLLPTNDIQWRGNEVIVSPFEWEDHPYQYFKARYICVDFDLRLCGAHRIDGKLFYYAKKGYNAYTSSFTIGGDVPEWKVMAPVFESDVSIFRGVEIPASARACLTSIHDMSENAPRAGALPYLYLPKTWKNKDFAMTSSIKMFPVGR